MTTGKVRTVWPFAVIAVLSVFNYWPMFTGKVPFPSDAVLSSTVFEGARNPGSSVPAHAEMGDLATQVYPWRQFAARTVRAGGLPLWNPYELAGSPFLANAQSALFYPLNWIYYLLPTPAAWAIFILLKVLLAGAFTALFARSIGASELGATAAGIIFGLGGFITAWQGWTVADVAIWLPLALFGIDRLRQAPSPKNVALTSGAMAMPLLAGHPETAAHVELVVGLFAVHRLLFSANGTVSRTKFAGCAAGAAILALGVAAVQLLPTLEWLRHVEYFYFWGALPVRDMVALWSRTTARLPTRAAYVGPLALALACCSIRHRPKRDVVFFALLAAVCVQMAYGFGPVYAVLPYLPVLRWAKNWRILFALDFSLAVMAGLGLSALSDGTARLGKMRLPAGGSMCLLALLAIDLLTFSHGYMPFARAADIFPPAPVFEFLRRQEPPFRVAAVNSAMGPNFEMPYELSAPDGYDIRIGEIDHMLDGLVEPGAALTLSAEKMAAHVDRRLDLLNVKFLIATTMNSGASVLQSHSERFRLVFSDRSVRVFQVLSALPRAYLVPFRNVDWIDSSEAQLARIQEPNFDPGTSVVLESASTRAPRAAATVVDAGAPVTWMSHTPDRITLTARADEPSVLVVSQMNYPGWYVSVDGRQDRLLRTDYAFDGVVLDRGEHKVELVFSPRSFRLGLACTIAATVVLAALTAL